MKKIYLLSIFLLLGRGAGAQTIYYVNIASGNDANAGTSWSTSFRNLTKAIAAANASSASEVDIWVAQGTYTPIDGISSLPSDHSDTSFTFYRSTGTGHALKVYGGFTGSESSVSARDTSHHTYLDGAISSGNSYHVGVIAGLAVSSDSVVLDGLTFRNGIANGTTWKNYNGSYIQPYWGGGLAMYVNNTSKVAIRNCVFYANSAIGINYGGISGSGGNAYGGGIYNNSSNCLLEQCSFINNTAAGNTGGTASGTGTGGNGGGGAVIVAGSLVNLNKCTFTGNSASGGHPYSAGTGGNASGGAIYFDAPAAGTSLTQCTFNNNCVLAGNGDAQGSCLGGAVFHYVCWPSYLNCSFIGNIATDSTGSSGATYHGKNWGGAVFSNGSAPRFDSCVFSYNRATHIHGGLALGGAVANVGSSSSFFTNSRFSYNTVSGASGSGGGAIVNWYGSYPSFTNCDISNNGDNNVTYGGAIYNFGPSGASLSFNKCLISNNISKYYGAGIYNDSGALSLIHCTISDNTTTNSNGTGGGLCNRHSRPFIDSCFFLRNIASYGGGIAFYDSSIAPTHCLFKDNIANTAGGAISCGDYSGAITGNFRTTGNVYINNQSKKGGAIRINLCTTCQDTIINNIFIGNKSSDTTSGGGAIVVNNSTNYINNNTFVNDTAMGRGGVIRIEGTGGVVRMANNIFYGSFGRGTSTDTSIIGTGSFAFLNNIYTGTNPLFIDVAHPAGSDTVYGTADDGLALQPCSPGVNSGNNSYVYTGVTTDFKGSPRILDATVDMGAYENNTVGAITGAAVVCIGSTTTLADTTAGGTWSSSDATIASVSTSGVVRGVSAGNVTITYTHTGGCATGIATRAITVERPVSAITATSDTLCIGGNTTMSDSVSGGTWASTNTSIATVNNTTGFVRALAAGIDTIRYTFTNSCGTTSAIRRIVVQRPAAAIAGADSLCRGTTSLFTDSMTGGTWSTSNAIIATINTTGTLTGIAAGIDTVIYTLTNACGVSHSYHQVKIQRPASAISVSDTAFCSLYYHMEFPSDSSSGGVWHLSNLNALTWADSTIGAFFVHLPGVDTLSYSVTNTCGTSSAYTVIRVDTVTAGTISGVSSICAGDSTQMTPSLPGGTWSSGSTGIATVSVSGEVFGVSAGSAIITYTHINTCGTYYTTITITVDGPPAAATITGPDTVCQGSSITLTPSTSGGTWGVTNSNATISSAGLVTGISPGLDTATYTLSNGCGSTVSIFGFNVYSTMHCDSFTAVPAVNNAVPELLVYPNPAYNIITVCFKSSTNEKGTVSISNIIGETVMEYELEGNKPVVKELHLPAGIYLLTATFDMHKYVKRIVIE